MLKIGFSLILWFFGSIKSVLAVVFNSLNPSDGISWVVLCLGTLKSLLRGYGKPVEFKQLIEGSNSLLYIYKKVTI